MANKIKSILFTLPSGTTPGTYDYNKAGDKDIEFKEGSQVTMVDIQVLSTVNNVDTFRLRKVEEANDIIEPLPLTYIKSRELITGDNIVRNIKFPVAPKKYLRMSIDVNDTLTADLNVLVVFQYQ